MNQSSAALMEVVYKMNWNRSTIFKFIDLYRSNPCLWDPQHEDHKNRFKLREAWEGIQKDLGMPCTLNELKRKKESLMSAYRAYTTRIKRCELEGKVYEPTWTYYDPMDSFLGSVYTCNVTLQTGTEDTEEDEDSNEDDDEESDVKSPKIKKVVSLTTKRKQYTPERRQRNQQMDEAAISYTNPPEESVSYIMETKPAHRQSEDDDDECSTFGILIAKKLRKLSDNRRDVMMVKINQLFVDERNERTSRHPHSTSSAFHNVSPSTSYNDPLLVEIKPFTRDRS